MKEPSLQRTTALSFIIHITLLSAAFLVLRQTNHFVMPSPYIVSLVGSDVLSKNTEVEGGDKSEVSEHPATHVETAKKSPDKKLSEKKEEQYASERIAAIEAKRKIERIVKLRNIISLKGRGSAGDTIKQTSRPAGKIGKGSILDGYYLKITREIWQQWVFPDLGDKNLEVIISIKITKDGTVTANKIEKSSGNPLFDRSALRAINKASPLSAPPYEMEIGVRFYP